MIIRPTLPETPNYTTPRGTIGATFSRATERSKYMRSPLPRNNLGYRTSKTKLPQHDRTI